MPSHPDRVRTAGLPEGYQHPTPPCTCAECWEARDRLERTRMLKMFLSDMSSEWAKKYPLRQWRAPHLNAAEQLARNADDMVTLPAAGWNVPAHDPDGHLGSDRE